MPNKKFRNHLGINIPNERRKMNTNVRRMRERESGLLKKAMGWRIDKYLSIVIATRHKALKFIDDKVISQSVMSGETFLLGEPPN
jgi:hypothetical protein